LLWKVGNYLKVLVIRTKTKIKLEIVKWICKEIKLIIGKTSKGINEIYG
jgi:hypothetical protein